MNYVRNYFLVLLSVIMVFFSIIGSSQSSRISYELSYKPDPTQKDNIVKRNYTLDIFNGESIFRTEMRKESDSIIIKKGFGSGYNTNPNYELYLTKDLNNEIFKKSFVSPISRDKFFIKIDDELKWKILPETIVMTNLNCQKAEVEYGGRQWIAWFTKDIPLFEGPYYFHGLPGLIIQIQDVAEDFIFTATEIKKLEYNSLYKINDGKEITWKQYEELMQAFFNSPYASVRVQGKKVYTDNGSGGYKEIDYRERTKDTQKMLLKNNNLIELNRKIKYK
jgi:GLPGLI family protein